MQDDVLTELDMLQSDILMKLCELSGAACDPEPDDINGKGLIIHDPHTLLNYLERTSTQEILKGLPATPFSTTETIERIRRAVPNLREEIKTGLRIRYEGGDNEG
jgi:hypothetical protein